jgi:predicted RNase H-like HicB family nuclease
VPATKVQVEREDDGWWIADIPDLPGVMTYGKTRDEAVSKAKALALRVMGT